MTQAICFTINISDQPLHQVTAVEPFLSFLPEAKTFLQVFPSSFIYKLYFLHKLQVNLAVPLLYVFAAIATPMQVSTPPPPPSPPLPSWCSGQCWCSGGSRCNNPSHTPWLNTPPAGASSGELVSCGPVSFAPPELPPAPGDQSSTSPPPSLPEPGGVAVAGGAQCGGILAHHHQRMYHQNYQ